MTDFSKLCVCVCVGGGGGGAREEGVGGGFLPPSVSSTKKTHPEKG